MSGGVHEADVELALRAAREAAAAIMESFGAEQEVMEKAPGQPVTRADLEADRVLRQILGSARPEYGWLSEETADHPDRLERVRVWIVDPIDGTRSFIAGRPEFVISIGLAERGEAVVGVVHNPATAEMFWAVKGGGAYASRPDGAGEPVRLRVTERSTADQAILLASRSEIRAGEFDPFHGGWRLSPAGSTAYKLAKVAAGEGDVFLSRGPKSEWDVCAGALLVEEAGGRATDVNGRSLRYNHPDPYVYGVLASNGRLHEEVLEVVGSLPPAPRLLERYRDPLHPGLR